MGYKKKIDVYIKVARKKKELVRNYVIKDMMNMGTTMFFKNFAVECFLFISFKMTDTGVRCRAGCQGKYVWSADS